MIKRRGFLIGLGVVAVASLGVWGADIAAEAEIVSGVRRRLPFLKFDEAGLHAFSKDYIHTLLAKRPSWYRWKYHLYSFLSKPAVRWGISTDKRSRRERQEDNFATLYLLSSDFFTTGGADESRTIQYVSLYDPIRACGNPFARPVVDPPSAVSVNS
jgi:hypothetical protein